LYESLDELLLTKLSEDLDTKKNQVDSVSKPLLATAVPPALQSNVSNIVTTTKKEVNEEVQLPTELQTEEPQNNCDDTIFYQSLQTVLDNLGLNTRNGIEETSVDTEKLAELALKLSVLTGISYAMAHDKLLEWQKIQLDVREKMEEQEKEVELAKAQNRKALVPIWRCGVCGRADKPYIACFVQPFIVRYEEVFYQN